MVPSGEAKHACTVQSALGWWSYRIIDGRKCWYEGKPRLSKSSLEWLLETSSRPISIKVVAWPAQAASDPMNAQALAPPDPITFDELWRARVEWSLVNSDRVFVECKHGRPESPNIDLLRALCSRVDPSLNQLTGGLLGSRRWIAARAGTPGPANKVVRPDVLPEHC